MVTTTNRKPFQGILNILRFNWHFYAIGLGFAMLLFMGANYFNARLFDLPGYLLITAIGTSLIVSCYIYDCTGFYTLDWLDTLLVGNLRKIINVNAGFDETSSLLQERFGESEMVILDFYDPEKHTEISIKRARKKYPAVAGTIAAKTHQLPVESGTADAIFLIFAAHEIRGIEESILFFSELGRVLNKNGKIILVEHLRDWPNFFAYTIGFFHFFSKSRWQKTIESGNLEITATQKLTPFTNAFIVQHHGNPSSHFRDH